jgi:hypothetical protein
LDLIFNDSLQQFSDYYETEGEEDARILNAAQPSEVAEVINSFKDYTKIGTDSRVSFPCPIKYYIFNEFLQPWLQTKNSVLTEFRDTTAFQREDGTTVLDSPVTSSRNSEI